MRICTNRCLATISLGLITVLSSCNRSDQVGTPGDPGGPPAQGSNEPGGILDAGGSAEPLRVDLPGRMSVLVQVVDDVGNPVSGLTNDNFDLFEDGQLVSPTESQQQLLPRPRVFRSFSHLLLDLSGSVAQTAAGQQSEIEAAIQFIDEVTQAEENYIAVSWFFGGQNIAPALLDDFTPLGFSNDRDLLVEVVQNVDLIQVTSTSTNLYGAIVDGLDVLDDALANSNSGAEFQSLTLVTFTDGTDQAGIVSRETAIARISNGPNTYNAQAIGLGSEIDTETLNAIGPNGYVLADNLGNLASTFGAVGGTVRDLANSFYLVGYISPKVHSEVERTLTVQASRGGGVATRDYQFVPQYFSGGAGFLEVREESVTEDLASWAHIKGTTGDHTLLLGKSRASGDVSQGIVLRELTENLGPNPSFGTLGSAAIPSLAGFDYLHPIKIATGPTGQIYLLVQGSDHAADTDPRVLLVEYTPNGQWVDTVNIAPVVGGMEDPRDLTVASDGFIMLLSRVDDSPNHKTAIRRFEPNSLVLDETFANGGVLVISAHPSGQLDEPKGMVADDAGGVYYTGQGYNAFTGGTDMMLLHVNADGSLDPSFGDAGLAMSQGQIANAGPGIGYDLRLDPRGRIVVAGAITPAGAATQRAAVWRFQANGTPDPSFFGNASNPYFQSGLVAIGGDLTNDSNTLFGNASKAVELRALSDGSLLVAGTRMNARGDQDLCTWRFNAAGLFNTNYNFTGFLIEDGSVAKGCDDHLSGLRFLPGGTLLYAGTGAIPAEGVESAVLWIDTDPIRQISIP